MLSDGDFKPLGLLEGQGICVYSACDEGGGVIEIELATGVLTVDEEGLRELAQYILDEVIPSIEHLDATAVLAEEDELEDLSEDDLTALFEETGWEDFDEEYARDEG